MLQSICFTYKALNIDTPTYLRASLTLNIRSRRLLSLTAGLVAEPRCRTVMDPRAFMPLHLWNGIDRHSLFVAQIHLLPSQRLKTKYFSCLSWFDI